MTCICLVLTEQKNLHSSNANLSPFFHIPYNRHEAIAAIVYALGDTLRSFKAGCCRNSQNNHLVALLLRGLPIAIYYLKAFKQSGVNAVCPIDPRQDFLFPTLELLYNQKNQRF